LAGVDESWLPAIALVPVVLAGRFVSVGLPGLVLRRFLSRRTPHAIKLLTWGGLRGGISVALAFSCAAASPWRSLSRCPSSMAAT
jgi:monovalent cation:H+ antiporter, CPA1 family